MKTTKELFQNGFMLAFNKFVSILDLYQSKYLSKLKSIYVDQFQFNGAGLNIYNQTLFEILSSWDGALWEEKLSEINCEETNEALFNCGIISSTEYFVWGFISFQADYNEDFDYQMYCEKIFDDIEHFPAQIFDSESLERVTKNYKKTLLLK